MKTEAIKNAAHEVSSWIEDAISDIACGDVQFPDADTLTKFKEAKKNGVSDITGWYADELYNDVDTLRDLTGDRIYDAAEGNGKEKWENMIRIAEAMQDDGHEALTIALSKHLEQWRKTITQLTY